ncbi:hypothetical protein PgNI_05433 [Pyricularia grisea]|uniref:Uncharacterized protein n=1 Tax=Pyricularia grisea TaxID=148305 RepID=A0A6P8B526_PYRGI|nr:hypothetical protein PgNI_05433 [Pyricularia grisea]TLD10368.1 hypothetical protein PgNI_05433 [Pyricularia grisea]
MANRDPNGRPVCPIKPASKVSNTAVRGQGTAGKGTVGKAASVKGGVPDKRKSFSDGRVQGAVVKSGKSTGLKSGNKPTPAKGITASEYTTNKGNSKGNAVSFWMKKFGYAEK